MKGDNFFLHGNYQIEASLGPNSVHGTQKGRSCVQFKDDDMTVYCLFPSCSIQVKKDLFNY